MDEKKYKFTNETITFLGKVLRRIEALKDFTDVKKGDKGGFIESEKNLSQKGNCWIYDNAIVYENAKIYENAGIYNNVNIHGNAKIYGNARIYNNATIYGNSIIYENAKIYGNTKVYDNATIYGNVMICGSAQVYGNATIYENAVIYDNVKVCGNTTICGNAEISGNATVFNDTDYIVFKNWWSSGRYFTWTRSNNMWRVGCFYGSGKELIEKAYKDSKLSGKEYKRVVDYVESIINEEI